MVQERTELEMKIKDIVNVQYSDSLSEVTSTMHVILTLYEIDDHPEVIRAAKDKLSEGIARLEQIADGAGSAAKGFQFRGARMSPGM